MSKLLNVLRDDEGATMVEYGIMVALIAAVCIAAVTVIGVELNDVFTFVGSTLETVGTGGTTP